MKVIYGTVGKKFDNKEPLCATIGNFDGVHLGHQALIKECQNYGMKSIVFTFSPHPNCVLKSRFEYHFLTSLEKKIDLIRKLKPDFLYIIKFDIKAASLSPDDFIKWLKKMNVKNFICGKDFHFGYKATGSIIDLKRNFNCIVLENQTRNSTRISSTCIKELIEEGKIKEANTALGRLYSIEGVVTHGSHIGNTLGFPTANIDIFGNQAPKNGVYAVKVLCKGKSYFGMANLGNNPSFNYTMHRRLETNIFDFNDNIYDEIIQIFFLDFIREEKVFKNQEDFILELKKNRETILELIRKEDYK